MTTVGDNFNRADSAALGTSSEGWSWTEVVGGIDIVSNQAVHQAAALASARAESDLASVNHYAQATLVSTPTTTARGGVCVRFASAANTYYAVWARRHATTTYRLLKVVAGTQTVIADVNSTAVSLPAVLKLEVDGSTLRGYVDGVQVITATDTSITGGTRAGIFAESNTGSVFDDFSAADLATGTNAAAENVTLTAAAHNAQGAVSPSATEATLTATANDPTTQVAPGTTDAAVTATAHDATVSIGTSATEATATATSHDPAAAVAVIAEAVAIVAAAHNATVDVPVSPGRMALTTAKAGMVLTTTHPGMTLTDQRTGSMTLTAT